MTELLYLPDRNYDKEFEAEVTKTREMDGYIVLDRTLFYPEGGGQPADRGVISWEGEEREVTDVKKNGSEVRHFVEGDDLPEPGTEVHGTIDWDRRYKHMRMHTAQHLLSWVVLQRYGASTAGNQIHEDRSRIDFAPVEFDEGDIETIEKQVNAFIQKDLEVEKESMSRDRVESEVEEGRTNLDLIPDSVDPLRVVVIGDEDLCPCGGTHVDSLGEIGGINITNRISKGADTERIEFELED
ncbi:MAG: alanyl-tRNA editing protein [Candidatus Nanohaloarchaea archaeon]